MDHVSAYIAVGSNIDVEAHVPEALHKLSAYMEVDAVSSHYRTAPMGGRVGDADYLNGVWCLRAEGSPGEIREFCRSLEYEAGRTRGQDRYSPRTLDLDLLLWGTLIDPDIGLPDPEILERPFLYIPLLELDKDLIWPLTRKPLRDMVPGNPPEILRYDEVMTDILRGIING